MKTQRLVQTIAETHIKTDDKISALMIDKCRTTDHITQQQIQAQINALYKHFFLEIEENLINYNILNDFR